MLTRDVKNAVIWTWLIVSVVLAVVAASPLLLPAELLGQLSPVCEARKAGRSCMLCGMTTAFLRIGSGDVNGALEAHSGSVALWSAFALNFIAAATYFISRRVDLCRPLR